MATTAVQRGGAASALYDVLDLILDKGLVIDVFARVSLVGIELITVDVRVVIASVDTYLRFAEATNRLDLQAPRGASPLTGALTGATGQLTGAAEGVTGTTGSLAEAAKGS
jgi:hypothetical protein